MTLQKLCQKDQRCRWQKRLKNVTSKQGLIVTIVTSCDGSYSWSVIEMLCYLPLCDGFFRFMCEWDTYWLLVISMAGRSPFSQLLFQAVVGGLPVVGILCTHLRLSTVVTWPRKGWANRNRRGVDMVHHNKKSEHNFLASSVISLNTTFCNFNHNIR